MTGKRRPRNAESPHAQRVTLADVARQSGVSAMTASRALRGERNVGPELVARVKKSAQQLGYIPDNVARALATRTGTHVAVLIPSLTNELFVDLLEQVHGVLRTQGYQTLFGLTHYDANEEWHLLREQLAQRPAGLLVTGLPRAEPTRRLLAGSGVPCVYMMEINPDPATYSVGFSQQDAAMALTEHLLARGRRRIAFVAAQMDPRTLQRMQGWRRTLRQHGLYDAALEFRSRKPSSLAMGAQMLRRLSQQHPEIDAIFFCNDDLAQGALLAAPQLGIAVPQRIAIAGFNDLAASPHMRPPLTTVRTPRKEIGRQSATMLLQLMRGQPVTEPALDMGFALQLRGST